MSLLIKIKAGNIHNLSDARYFSTFAEWIGFNVDVSSPHGLTVKTAKELIGWLAGPKIVGEFGEQPIEVINEIAQALLLETIQTDIDLALNQLRPPISTIIRRIVWNEWIDADRLESILTATSGIAYFLLDFSALEWENMQAHPSLNPTFLKELCTHYPIILQLPFSKNNVIEIVHFIQPLALNITGGKELKIGMRSFETIDPIIEALEVEGDDCWV